jgi:hypothetical protein
VELTPVGALAFFIAADSALADVAPLAVPVTAAPTIEAARAELEAIDVRTELDYEIERAAELKGARP